MGETKTVTVPAAMLDAIREEVRANPHGPLAEYLRDVVLAIRPAIDFFNSLPESTRSRLTKGGAA